MNTAGALDPKWSLPLLPEEPLVSVLTTSYNHRRWVQDTVDSVACQTYRSVEHVIVDDGSTDGSQELLGGIAGERAHVCSFENCGQARAATRPDGSSRISRSCPLWRRRSRARRPRSRTGGALRATMRRLLATGGRRASPRGRVTGTRLHRGADRRGGGLPGAARPLAGTICPDQLLTSRAKRKGGPGR